MNNKANGVKVLEYNHNLHYKDKGKVGECKIRVYKWSFRLFFVKLQVSFPLMWLKCNYSYINAGLDHVTHLG